MKVHHVGYLVKKIKKAKKTFLALGYEVESDIVYDDYRKIEICFLVKDGYRIELVSPVNEESVVSHLIKTYRNSPYHLCYETDRLDEDVQKLEDQAFICLGAPRPAPALDGKRVVFLMNASIGLIELYEV